ncbi:hypothetical protein ACP70R_040926 [Stipagrostis hirtigluma subsp. patula]
MAAAATTAASGAAVESVVVVHNVAKRHNVGTLARSATAFGVAEVVVVGRRDVSAFGSHGATSHLRFRHFASLALARAYLKDERGCDICGVEITEDAMPVTAHPFRRSTAFLFGNEGTGLSQKECEVCDFFVYIPQYGGGTASLNVTVAASIVLHHFGEWVQYGIMGTAMAAHNHGSVVNPVTISREMLVLVRELLKSFGRRNLDDLIRYLFEKHSGIYRFHGFYYASNKLKDATEWSSQFWAGFPERGREGNKFIVAGRPQGHSRGLYGTDSIEALIEERKIRKENACDILEENGSGHPQESNGLELMFAD